jgi:HK97 family phage major capsid protein
MNIEELTKSYNSAGARVEALQAKLVRSESSGASAEAQQQVENELRDAIVAADAARDELDAAEARERARAEYRAIPLSEGGYAREPISVREPDMYQRGGRSFVHDLYRAQLRDDPSARDRIDKHHRFEVEKRSVSSATLGGIIPPQYLVDLYAKASRNGRVFADQVNQQVLPEVGMSLIVPRLTQGLAAGAQASENTAVSTQDPTETDLTVNVRTIAGYSPVSRQGLERAQYSDQILFEDLIARYWASLDSQALNGAGTSGTLLGLLQTSGIATSTVSTITAAGVYPKVADLAQQISVNVGGIGYLPDKVFMHPRRWAFFAAALDSQNRPFVVPTGTAYNPYGTTVPQPPGGVPGGFGGPVGTIAGFPVWIDPNIPTNLGTNTNEDRIIMIASGAVHLWERGTDPVTLSFEQQAGTSLQVQLVVYGYAAFTAGRLPGASGAISGLTPPSF